MMAPPLVCIAMSMLRPIILMKIRNAYRRLFAPLTRNWDKLADELLQPMLHLPRVTLSALARFGLGGLWPATLLARGIFQAWEPARALFAGIAAHSFLPLEAPVSSAFVCALGAAGHAFAGNPAGLFAGDRQRTGRSSSRELGGKIETNRRE